MNRLTLTPKNQLYSFALLGVFLLLFSTSIFAQNPYNKVENDFGVWTKAELDQKHNDEWKSSYSFAYRRKENTNEFRNAFFEYAINRDLKKKFDTGMQFRFSIDQSEEYGFRWAPYLVKAYRLKPITFKYRIKNDFDFPVDFSSAFEYRSRVRNRIEAEYERNKYPISVEVSAELFHRYDLNSMWLSNIRLASGIKYEISKSVSFGLGYFVQQEHNEPEPVRDHVVTIDVSYNL